ncbi:DUF2490 domain-containing protein [Legionella longbeachae]|uniref:DUF2490 domain-containing protein n=1 Tax=Legionella longbeachae serogroup 1 (strain NSW150) TaxID=661367 RepID=D3HKE5_LEGLN|nr:DUF2490 domain-containing protein [Legionella longbeachae]VEE03426.1 Protein of uncharacterised function (DUF2490) [Legionella oakridgensis]HBD7397702.1 DUF2490 domain-containing protein [Legionella pneumophila]ARB93680.1 DUF2490 domain-containing protein [Legionella longbeachae]ARM33179.1 DUF2490 domain-containing protein [Legionella longbeachae]EEZ93969.1 conserved hypothetical protein [Legionella longbeachae D-4968]
MKLLINRAWGLLLVSFVCQTTHPETQSYGSFWLTGTFIGPITRNHEKWKYYLEPRLIVLDDRYGLSELHFYYATGYQLSSKFTPYIGAAYFLSENTEGVISHENVIWQQFLWNIYKTDFVNISNRSRLEERKNTLHYEWATRLREQITLKIPVHNTKYSLVTFDESFLNFNHPPWVSDKFFAQNRYFFGIGKQLSTATNLDIGYINQIKFERQNLKILDNGLYIKLNVSQ